MGNTQTTSPTNNYDNIVNNTISKKTKPFKNRDFFGIISDHEINEIKNKKNTIIVDSFDEKHVLSKMNEHNDNPTTTYYNKINFVELECMIQYFNTHPNKELYQNADCLCNYLYIYETGQDNSYCIVNPNKIKERNINGSVLHLKNNFIKATYFGGYELEYFNTHQLRRPE